MDVDGRQIPLGNPNIIAGLDNAQNLLPLGRAGDPIDIGNAVYMLAIPESP